MVTFELCASSYKDALTASFYNVKRIELNSSLSLGGLTPSVSLFNRIRNDFPNLDIIVMIRIRAGGFHYSKEEYEIMLEDLRYFLTHGATGIAFGFLNEDYTIDELRTKEVIDLIHSYHKTAVFHRAIDLTDNIDDSVNTLVNLHIDRILTSGSKKTAIEGKTILSDLVNKYGKDVDIQAGCGINDTNVKELLDLNITSIHGSCGTTYLDHTSHNNDISFDYIGKGKYEGVDENKLKNILQIINAY